MKTNTITKRAPVYTHEGAKAYHITPAMELRRSVMACMLFEDTFYESGVSVTERIAALIPKVKPAEASQMAIEARSKMKLRHVPLFLVREMARQKEHRKLVGETLAAVIQRPDELGEFLSLYWKPKKEPLAAQVKKGLAAAFQRFDAYALAKYDRAATIKLRDVLFLCHAKPKDEAQAALWKQLVDGTLPTPDTWEVELSASKDKKASWTRLLSENKLGALALLRNLRNMKDAEVSETAIRDGLARMKVERVLPFRFIAAARYAPHLEDGLEQAMFRCVSEVEKLKGKTAIVVDNSGSMNEVLSAKSEMKRVDAACGLAVLCREICEQVVVIGFGDQAAVAPPRRGFALRDAITQGPGGGTNTQNALRLAANEGYDRIIVITDEQSHQTINPPETRKAYFVNVATFQHGIGYGQWTHVDGFSEAIIDYIREFERE